MAKYRKTALTEAHRISDLPHEPWLTGLIDAGCVTVHADGTFTVGTREGLKTGEPNGWVALDGNGDPYPIAADVFDKTYEAV
jgi:hypothetical protein